MTTPAPSSAPGQQQQQQHSKPNSTASAAVAVPPMMNLGDWQSRLRAQKEQERKKKTESAQILAGYRGGVKEDDLKLAALRELERKKKTETAAMLAGYRGGETLHGQERKLSEWKQEDRQKQKDAQMLLQSYRKKELDEAERLRLQAAMKRQQQQRGGAAGANVPTPVNSVHDDDGDDPFRGISPGAVSNLKGRFKGPAPSLQPLSRPSTGSSSSAAAAPLVSLSPIHSNSPTRGREFFGVVGDGRHLDDGMHVPSIALNDDDDIVGPPVEPRIRSLEENGGEFIPTPAGYNIVSNDTAAAAAPSEAPLPASEVNGDAAAVISLTEVGYAPAAAVSPMAAQTAAAAAAAPPAAAEDAALEPLACPPSPPPSVEAPGTDQQQQPFVEEPLLSLSSSSGDILLSATATTAANVTVVDEETMEQDDGIECPPEESWTAEVPATVAEEAFDVTASTPAVAEMMADFEDGTAAAAAAAGVTKVTSAEQTADTQGQISDLQEQPTKTQREGTATSMAEGPIAARELSERENKPMHHVEPSSLPRPEPQAQQELGIRSQAQAQAQANSVAQAQALDQADFEEKEHAQEQTEPLTEAEPQTQSNLISAAVENSGMVMVEEKKYDSDDGIDPSYPAAAEDVDGDDDGAIENNMRMSNYHPSSTQQAGILSGGVGEQPLHDRPTVVRLDVLFSFGLVTLSDRPYLDGYMQAVEEVVRECLLRHDEKSSILAKHVSYDPMYGPFVKDCVWDDNFENDPSSFLDQTDDNESISNAKRVMVTAAVPVFLTNGVAVSHVRNEIIAALQHAIEDGHFLEYALQGCTTSTEAEAEPAHTSF